MEDILQTILDKVLGANSLRFYFVLRQEKENVVARRKVLDKYNFSLLRVDINEEIKIFMQNLVQKQIQHAIDKELELTPYEVISDDQEQVFTYSELNRIGSFAKIIQEILPNHLEIPTMQNFDEIFNHGLIWAYCIELSYQDNEENQKFIYTFRKLNSGNIVVDARENNPGILKHIVASFSTRSNKLEMFSGSAIKLDATVDCVFDDGLFYILQKRQFETLVGLAEDFHTEALSVVEELKQMDKFVGIDLVSHAIESNTAIHKKLVRLKKLKNYAALDHKMISNMKKAAKTEKYKLKLNKEGKIIIENTKDVDMVIKLLCDYYKQGVVRGKKYGTYSGKYFANADNFD